ncbi:O-methyltransferase [Nocardia cyriacigeorgica]|uniref:O-methyltransferase n=1 Tax=Nocardia cyriacigeorgica TaxID=135487 RepID=UPI0024576C42|nr:class I SAM-dependent methyltransferase [Nocardia cyriacigeorgica]
MGQIAGAAGWFVVFFVVGFLALAGLCFVFLVSRRGGGGGGGGFFLAARWGFPPAGGRGAAPPPKGRVVTMEYEPKHAEVARANLDRKGVGDRVDIRVGVALDSLPVLEQEGQDPFDLVFIDADKVNNANYVRWALRLTRPGSVIIVDNVVRGGKITNGHSEDSAVRASREVLELLDSEPRLDATALQTVGSKGWDGFAYALVTG